MSRFTVQLTRAAVKDLDAVPPVLRRRLAAELRALADLATSWPPGIKRLRGFGFPLYRLRSGDYRVLFRLDEPVVTIMRVINRKDLERTLRHLRRS
ncbi:MAG: type II toxin-antitoxin system RelE/ParE family toxin [Gemmatimonadales bacterium]|nr:type II toxin-antitoxin system RelE/ParE family toxin [Gemmatimonadales bacterium]